MKKNKYKSIILSSLIFLISASPILAIEKINTSIKYNKLIQPMKTNTINKNGNILVAFRDLFNILNAEIRWDEVFRTITAKFDENELIIYVDSGKLIFNKKEFLMPIKPEIIDATTYIPLRFIFETIGYKVEWDSLKKEISINNDYGKYLILNEKENNKDSISLDEALKIALENNSNLKNLNDAQSYMQKVRKNLYEESQKEDDAFLMIPNLEPIDKSLEILKKINSTDNLIKNQEINKKIIQDSIELSIISSIIAIRNIELNIELLEKNIEIGKININNLQSKFNYGIISKNMLDDAIENQKTLEFNLSSLKSNLEIQKNNLNDILKTNKNVDININLNAKFEDLEKIDLEYYINQKKSNDLSIQIIENEINTAEYELKNSPDVSSTEKERLQNNINSAKRKLTDAKSNLNKKIRKTFDILENCYKNQENLKIALENAISNYNIAVSNYNNGNNTLFQVEQAKLAILKAEKNIEENELNFCLNLYTFYKPYLL